MKEIAKVGLQFFKQHPFLVGTNIGVSVLIPPIQDVLLPHLYGNVISAIEKKTNIIKPFIVVIAILSALQICYVMNDWHDTKVFPPFQAFIRYHMLESLFNNYETQYQDLALGDIMSKFIKIPAHLTQWFERMKNYVLPYILTYIIAIIYFIVHDKYLGIGLAILIAIYVYVVIGSPIFCETLSVVKDKAQNDLHEEIDDTLRNLISVYGSDQKQEELDRLDIYEKKYTKAYEDTMNCASRTRAMVIPITIGFLVFFTLRCVKQIKANKMSSASFVPLFIIVLYILNSMLFLTDQIRDMLFEIGILSAFEDMFAFEATEKRPRQSVPQGVNIPDGLYFHNVTFKYKKSNKSTIEDFSLYIRPGERIAIVGEIGSGKSTILKLILKLQEPVSGEIFLNGQAYADITVQNIRRRIGYVPQQPMLFNRTIIENIKYGNDHLSDNDVTELIHKLNLDSEFSHLEKGLNTDIGKNGSKISGGQRQLVWCLRVLLSNPEVLILDEPTASLDERTKKLMKSLYDTFMQNRTVIIVTHDPTLMQYANRIVEMNNGVIVSDRLKKS